ncbi:HMA2 domain-containing protein [Nostoc sp. NIES-2111]
MEDSASSSSDAVPRPLQQSCTHSQKTFYSVTYALPGQIAYCIPRMSEDPKYRQNLLRLLEAQSGIRYQEINEDTGSLVIAYESGLMSDMEMREHLASLFQAAEMTKTEVTLTSTKEPIISPSPPQSVTNSQATEQPVKVAYSVVHSIPGRVRFHVPKIATDSAYVQRLEALLQSDPVVISERINRMAASVIITYQPGKVRRLPQQPLQSIFAVAVAYFSSLIESAGITANTSSSK